MTEFEQFAGGTERLANAAARLETIERRHRIVDAGLTRIAREAEREHMLGRLAPRELARLARLDRLIARGEAEALAIVRGVLPLLAADGDRG